MMRLLGLRVLALVLLGCTALAADDSPLAPVRTDNPRDTMRTFITAMDDYGQGVRTNDERLKQRIGDAVACLNLEDLPALLREDKGQEAAILIKEVIDRVIVIDYEKVPEKQIDGGPVIRWRLKDTNITITQVEKGERRGEHLFSRETVTRAKEFYGRVQHLPYVIDDGGAEYRAPWVERAAPAWAKKRWVILPNWQWLGIFTAILLGLVVKVLCQHLFSMFKRASEKSSMKWDTRILQALERPVGLVGAGALWWLSLHLLRFSGTALSVLNFVVQIIFSVGVIWTLFNLVDILTGLLQVWAEKTESTLDDHLVPLARKALHIFVVAFGVLVTFQSLGFNVMSVLAGLGLGGLAFALAAKDTCANLFGSIMIFLDRPFLIGDWVIVDGLEGMVEEIGFRSTRIRTFYNSQVTVPNSTMASANIDNMGRREYRRIKAFLGLTYDTPAEKLEAFVEGIKNIVKANPYTRKDYFHVVFSKYGDFYLEVMLYCFLKVPDWSHELVERQNIFLEILRLAEEIGVSFAFPTQTLHVDTFPEKRPINEPHVVERDKLAGSAASFGLGGSLSQPRGQGLFTAPYDDDKQPLVKGSDGDGDS